MEVHLPVHGTVALDADDRRNDLSCTNSGTVLPAARDRAPRGANFDARHSFAREHVRGPSGDRDLARPDARTGPGNLAEHRTGSQTGTPGVIKVEESAHQFTGSVETLNDVTVVIDDLGTVVYLKTSKSECDAQVIW